MNMNRNYNPNFPPVVMNLLIINVLIFLATSARLSFGPELKSALTLYFPTSPGFRFWQPLTHMFVHADSMHLFVNMFTLWMFGRTVEYDLGPKKFIWYYLICGFGAALLQLAVNWIEINALANAGDYLTAGAMIQYGGMVGASGAIFGLLAAFGILHANSMVMMLVPPIPMKAKWFVLIYAVVELLFGVTGVNDGVAHFAHLGGALWGFLILLYWKKKGKIYY